MINVRPMVRRLMLVVALSVLALGLLLTATAQADPIVWRPIFGTPLNLGSNATYTTTFGALGLSFPFNGKTYSNTDILSIASNGFVSLGGNNGDGSGTISGSELVNSPYPRIAALWTSLNTASAGGNVYLNVFNDANPSLTRVAVTWQAPFTSNGMTATVQLALQRNGAIVMAYNGLPQSGASGPALIGLSSGLGSSNPGSQDLSLTTPFTITQPTVYETFDLASNPVDLDQKNLVFVPNGTSGYNVQIPQTDLEVSQIASPTPVEPNQPLTYTIAVLNAGTITATDVTITDTLPVPAGVIFKSYTMSNGGTCSGTGIVICNLGTIPTSSPLVTVTIAVTPTRVGPITNTVSVGGNEVEYPLALWDNLSSLTSPVGQADLSVSAQGTPATVIAGNSLITYTLTITNNGIDTATGVSLLNMLPSGVDFALASLGCSWAGTVTCSLGDMATGTTQNITISGIVKPWARGLITNTVSVTLTNFDPDLNNNVATTTSFANASTSLSLIKTAYPSPAIAGTTLTYTLNFTNAGPSAATHIALTDTLPSGVTFGGILDGGATYSSTLNAVLWGDQSVRTATYAWIDIKNSGTRVAWPAGESDEGHAAINLPSWAFPWFGNSYSTLYIDPNGNVGFEDWPIATRTGDSRIPNLNQPNDRIAAFYTDMLGPNPTWCNGQADGVFTRNDVANGRFIIQYNNWCSKRDGKLNTFEVILKPDGSVTVQYNNVSSAPPMLLSTVSPAGVESPDGSSGFVWNGTITNTAAWVFQPYFLGSESVVYTVTVPANAVTGSSIINMATITAVEPGQTPGNNTSTVTTPVTRIADLSLVKVASTTQLPESGTPITYTLIATNNGPSNATSVVLTDTLPLSLTLGPITTSQGSCTGTVTIVCSLGDLPISSPSATVTIVVTPAQTIANTASASATETDPNLINNTSTATTTVGTANLSIAISDLPDPVIAGNVLTYTVTVTNINGNATATGVTLSDTLPAGTTFASASIPCSGTSTLSCSLPDIVTGTSTAATITVNVAPSTHGSIGNSISVKADQYDSDPSNNIASTTTTVNAQVDLSLTKIATSSPKLHPGMPLTYTLIITNNGPSIATNVIVTDTLPLSVTFESITSSAGNCSNSSNVVCTIGTLAPNATATISLIVKPIALGPVTYVIHSTAPSATTVEPASLTVTNAADVTVTPYTVYLPLILEQR